MAIADRSEALAALRTLDHRFRPVTMADRQLLPVIEPLQPLVPGGGLRRGSTVRVAGSAGTSLALALVAEASGQGSWVAMVGMASVGLVAAAELGVALDRVALVPHPPAGSVSSVVAALVDAVDVVLLGAGRVRPTDARRLMARARERGAVLVPVGADWPEAPDLVLTADLPRWEGLGEGHGHLAARRVRVEVTGRRDAARARSTDLWMPAPAGGVAAVHHPSGHRPPTRLRSVG